MGTLGRGELERRLGYHPAGPATGPIFDLNRAAALVLAELWDQVLPASREAACAQTALQEALMWANAAVACNLDPEHAVLEPVEVEDRLGALLDRIEGPEMHRNGADEPDSGQIGRSCPSIVPGGSFRCLVQLAEGETTHPGMHANGPARW